MNLGSALDDHPLAAFVLLAYGVSWSAWSLRAVPVGIPPLGDTLLLAVGAFGPAVAAVALAAVGPTGLRAWLGRTFRVGIPLRYWALALLLPVLAVGVAGGVHVLAFGGTLTLDALPSPIEYPIYLAVVAFLFGGQEEPGWRGYLLPRLAEARSTLAAALVVGVAWVGWHLPLFALPDTVQSGVSFPLYAVQLLGMSVILAWLAVSLEWAVLPAAVLHAGANAALNYYPVGGPAGATTVVGTGLLTAVVAVVALGIAVRFGPSLGRDDGGEASVVPTAAD